ncbi:hypothetical protein JAAARDRAFT_52958 [Jaapia argillacea MUCL 33604]|uniref:TrmE-type G domain-containing protein n=1 Tax=Jaapia argillacea MUCL 33604 TaxID=933084 RepID=A0A067QDM8_9AGAM|nr:hypothetical protein JAAARDRAFT_52958 [Jaapia argillacea MUCL 33604]
MARRSSDKIKGPWEIQPRLEWAPHSAEQTCLLNIVICVDAEVRGWGCNSVQLPASDAQRRTIYALSTPTGKAGVGVVRISGPDALDVWRVMVRLHSNRVRDPEPWKMECCRIVDPKTEELLDDGLAVFFKGPRSFTTQDVVELHIHSGRAIISSILSALSQLPYCRPAEPGEFTRRAFEGGRLDLTQVEGLKDLIDAETESQRKIALRAAGVARFEELRTDIIHCLALVEALIDFGEGEEIEEGVYEQARQKVIALHQTIQNHLSDNRRGEVLRSGIRLAIFGPPNAGKSSLLNFLAQREAAIVTPIPGTTRDILELSLDIGGLPVIVADTAGLRHTEDVVEKIGVERARNMVQGADISLCVLSLPEIAQDAPNTGDSLQYYIPPSIKPLVTSDTFFLLNKSDLAPHPTPFDHLLEGGGNHASRRKDRSWIVSLTSDTPSSEEPIITHARHRVHLESALRFLEAFLDTSPEDVVLAAEELRYAAQAVGKVSGLIDVEDILDAVFRDFCIGK